MTQSVSIFIIISLCTFLFYCNPDRNDWKSLGKIKPKSALEVETSDLWIGGEVLDRDLCDYDAYKEYLGRLGAKKIRLQSGWAKTEKEKGTYNFTWLDHIVDDAISRGVQPWIQISYGNPIYPGGGGATLGQGLVTSDSALKAFANYTRSLVSHFKERVFEWEIWNEADLNHNITLGHDENTYARLFVKIAEAVKEIQPEAKIVALSLAYVQDAKFTDGFFKYLKEHDKVELVDVFTFHGYPRNPDRSFDYVNVLIKTATKYKPDIEFWQGETGCPSTFGSQGALRNYPWTEHTQAKWNLRRALAHLGQGYKFSLFLISEFVYNDELRKGLNTKGILQINTEDFSIVHVKEAYYAYQNLCSVFGQELKLIDNLRFKVGTDSSISVFGWRGVGGKPLIAYWNDDQIPSGDDNHFDIDLTVEGVSFKDPVLVDPLNGKVKSIPKTLWSKDKRYISFKGIPCYDSPFIVVEQDLLSIDN